MLQRVRQGEVVIYLNVKLLLLFIGAPLALLAAPLGTDWLFFVGLGLLAAALVLPARPGQTPQEKLGNLAGHLPLIGRSLRSRSEASEPD